MIWSVSYYVEAERMWQFAGEGSRQWAQERAAWLRDSGHDKVRIRWRHKPGFIPVAEVPA